MADQLITQELLQSLNARLNESIRKQAETVNLMAGRDPNFRGLVNDLEALCDAPMSKALEKADVWRTRLRQAISEYKVPEMTRDDANQVFDVENSEFRTIHGFSQPAERMLQKGAVGYHLYHPLTGRVDAEPIVYPYTPKVDVFYEQQCVKHVTDGKSINMPYTMLSVLQTGEKMGLTFRLCVLMIRQIMKKEKQVNYDDVKDIEDPAEFMDALVGFFDFKTERNRILKLMKLCHRKVGQSIAPPVNRYRNLVKDLIYLEGINLTDDEIMEKANREAKKVMFKFLEKNTAIELKEYITKKARDENAAGFAGRTNLQDLYHNVEKLERVRGYQLQTDKHLVTVDHEVSLFYLNLQEVELEQADLDGMALDLTADVLLYNTRHVDIGNDVPRGDMSEYGYGQAQKPVSLEKPRTRRRSSSRNGRSSSRGRENNKSNDSTEKRVEWKDSATETDLCVICGENYDEQTGNKCRKDAFCNVYSKPVREKETRFCMTCAKAKHVKAYHGSSWCKTRFEQVAQETFPKFFATTMAQMQQDCQEQPAQVPETGGQKSENC